MYKYVLLLHVVAATIWKGGPLVLAATILPKTLEKREQEYHLEFETGFERIGHPALLSQVITGGWLTCRLWPDLTAGFAFILGRD